MNLVVGKFYVLDNGESKHDSCMVLFSNEMFCYGRLERAI